jgi:excisionase family DNA binding protein
MIDECSTSRFDANSDYCPEWNNASEKVIIGIRFPTYCLAVGTTMCDYSQSKRTHVTGIPAHWRSDMQMQGVVPNGSGDVFEPLLDSQQAAELMRLHPESVKRLARTGAIVAAKVGGVWRFRVSALEVYMQKITEKTQTRIAENMAPSKPAVGVVRNWRT